MGEKIRDIRTITLCGQKLMVELNEGYNSAQGKVIHIQNSSFRYLLKIKDFYAMSADILRAKAEFDYLKQRDYFQQPKDEADPYERADFNDFELLRIFSENRVDFRILKGLEKIVTIVVNPKNVDLFSKIIHVAHCRKYLHPISKYQGYSFLYQMAPFKIYKYKSRFYEVFFQLPCLSLTEKTWMPLDKVVQGYLWAVPAAGEGGEAFSDDRIRFIYRLTDCVFRKRGFHDYDKVYFEQRKSLLHDEVMDSFLEKVFFKHKNIIVDMICEGRYDELVQQYLTQTNY